MVFAPLHIEVSERLSTLFANNNAMTEFYLPPDALQGQDVPGHVLWDTEESPSVTITLPPTLTLKELFNVTPDAVEVEAGVVRIKSVVRDGYLGFVLKSRSLESLNELAEVSVSLTSGSKELFSGSTHVSLFRPSLRVASAPTQIVVPDEQDPRERVALMIEGQGTLLLVVKNAATSEVKLVMPDNLVKALTGFAKDMKEGMEALELRFGESYSGFFSALQDVDFANKDVALQRIANEAELIASDEEFVEAFQTIIYKALLANSDYEALLLRALMEFVRSTSLGGAILTTPFLEIPLEPTPKKLELEIECRDLLGHQLSTTVLPPILVSAPTKTSLPLSSLFLWRRDEGAGHG